MADPRPRATRGTSWFAGLVMGLPTSLMLLEIPVAGLVIAGSAAVLVWKLGQRQAGLGGLLVGIGLIGTLLLGRVWISCTAETGCTAPTIEWYLAVEIGILAVGLVLSALGWAHDRRH